MRIAALSGGGSGGGGGGGTITTITSTGATVTITNPNGPVTNLEVAGGTGTVTTVSVASANGFAGTVANPTTTPAITVSTTITGVIKGNGTAISAATAGTDYSAGTAGLATGILKSTTGTGALTIATAGTDYLTPSGSGAGLSGVLLTANNLSDVPTKGTGRANLRIPSLASVQAASDSSIGNVNIAAPGASLDGFTFLSSGNDTFLLTAQSTASQNGPWVWNGAATPATRPTDWPHNYVATTGRMVMVQGGANNINTLWIIDVPSAGITVDTTAQTWVSLNILPNLFNEQAIRSQPLNQMTPPTATVTFNGQDIVGIASESYFSGVNADGAINITLNPPLISMLSNATDTNPVVKLGLVSSNPTLGFAAANSVSDWFIARTATFTATVTGQLIIAIPALGSGTTALTVTGNSAGADQVHMLIQGSNAASRSQFVVRNTAAFSTSNKSTFALQAATSVVNRTIFQFDASFSNTTDANRTGTVIMSNANNGSFSTAITLVGIATTFAGNVGFNGAAAQGTFASGGAAPAGGTGATAGAYDTAAHRDALITLVNNMRTALINIGIMT